MSPTPEQPHRPESPGMDGRRIAIGALAALLVLAVAGLAWGASRLAAPSAPALDEGPGSGWVGPGSHGQPFDRGTRGPLRFPRAFGTDGLVPGRSALSISAISGSDVTLSTADGWTRTISVTDQTTITRAGEAITLADLHVGDAVRIRQTRNADGSTTVTAIEVVLPKVAGEVTATGDDTITLQLRDGSTFTVHVDAGTTYQVRGVTDASLSDIAVGMVLVAQGTQNDDGSLQAVAVYAGQG